MSFTVRSLLGRVTPYRPDLENPGIMEFFLQEAARRVMQDTFLGQVVQTTFYLPRGVDRILLTGNVPFWDVYNNQPNMLYTPNANPYLAGTNTTGLNGNMMFLPAADTISTVNPVQLDPVDVLRVTNFRIANPSITPVAGAGNFRGYARTLPPTPSWLVGDFLIMLQPGSVTQNSVVSTWNAGDVIYYNTSAPTWTVYPAEQFQALPQSNPGNVEHSIQMPVYLPPSTTNYQKVPSSWSQRTSRMSYIPTGPMLSLSGNGNTLSLGNASVLIAVGQTATFTATIIQGDGILSYQWYQNGAPITGANNASYSVTNALLSQSGNTYYAVVTGTDGSTQTVTATLTVAPMYFLTWKKYAAIDPSHIYLLYNDAAAPYISVYNGATETVWSTLPGGGNWLEIGLDGNGLIHAYQLGPADPNSGNAALLEFTQNAANPTGWTLLRTINYVAFWGPGYNVSSLYPSIVTMRNGDVVYTAQIVNASVPAQNYVATGYNTTVEDYTSADGHLHPCGFTGVNAQYTTLNLNFINLTILSTLNNPTDYTAIGGPSARFMAFWFSGTGYPYLTWQGSDNKLHVNVGSAGDGHWGTVTTLNTFNYNPSLSLPPAVAASKALIYLATPAASGALAVWFNGTTVTEDLIPTNGKLLFSGLPVKSINSATFQTTGRATVLSDGSVIHSINAGYFN